MPTGSVTLDLDNYVRINAGLNPIILQAHRDAVKIAFSDFKPVKNNTAFHLLSSKNAPYYVPIIDTNVWALSVTETSSLVVTEFSGSDDGKNPVDTIAEMAALLSGELREIQSTTHLVVRELRLLNDRAEHAWQTRIHYGDVT